MRNNKLNRNFKRLLAISLGACCTSTIMVNAMEQNNINQNEEHQNEEIQNEVATSIQTMLIGITPQDRQTIWNQIYINNNATSKGKNLNFLSDARGAVVADTFPFLLLTCQVNNQNKIKLMMIKDDAENIYILPYSESNASPMLAKHITQYVKNNPNISIARFENDCWDRKDRIAQYLVALDQPNKEGPDHGLIQTQEQSVFQKGKEWFLNLPPQSQAAIVAATIPVAGPAVLKMLSR